MKDPLLPLGSISKSQLLISLRSHSNQTFLKSWARIILKFCIKFVLVRIYQQFLVLMSTSDNFLGFHCLMSQQKIRSVCFFIINYVSYSYSHKSEFRNPFLELYYQALKVYGQTYGFMAWAFSAHIHLFISRQSARVLAAYLYLRPLTMEISLSELELSAACFWHFRDTELQWTQCSCHANIQTLNVSVNHIHTTQDQSGAGRSHYWPIRAEQIIFCKIPISQIEVLRTAKGSADWTQAGVGISSHLYSRRGPRCVECVTSNVPISNHLMCDYNCSKTVRPLAPHHPGISLLTRAISDQGQEAAHTDPERISSSHINS